MFWLVCQEIVKKCDTLSFFHDKPTSNIETSVTVLIIPDHTQSQTHTHTVNREQKHIIALLAKARAEITNLENDKDNILTLREKNLKWEKVNLPDFTM